MNESQPTKKVQKAPDKRGAKRRENTPARSQGATVSRTLSIGSRSLTMAARNLFGSNADFKFRLVSTVAPEVLGRAAVAEKAASLHDLIDLQCTEVQAQLETLAELHRRAKAASQVIEVDAKRQNIKLALGTRTGFRAADLVDLIDQAMVGADGLWISGVLPDAKRDSIKDGLLKRLHNVQRAVDVIGRDLRAQMQKAATPKPTEAAQGEPSDTPPVAAQPSETVEATQ